MLIKKIGIDGSYLCLKITANNSVLKNNKKKKRGKTITDKRRKLSLNKCITFSFVEIVFEISMSITLPITLTSKPNNGISNEPLKNNAKSAGVRRYRRKILSIHFEI